MKIILITVFLLLCACSESNKGHAEDSEIGQITEQSLLKTENWPIKINGKFEFTDGGDTDAQSGHASWLTGILTISDSENDLSVMILENALVKSNISEEQLEDCHCVFWIDGFWVDPYLAEQNIELNEAVFSVSFIEP